jgi:hypothetical protein
MQSAPHRPPAAAAAADVRLLTPHAQLVRAGTGEPGPHQRRIAGHPADRADVAPDGQRRGRYPSRDRGA